MLRLLPTNILILAAASLAFAVGWSVNGWRLGVQIEREKASHASTREQYQATLAHALAEAEIARQRLAEAAREVIRERNDEIERLRVTAERIPERLRIPTTCPSLPAPSRDLPRDPGDDPGSPRGLVPEGMAEGDQGLDISRVTELMRRADEVAADLRAALEICRR
jgi:hypothetical protein